MTDKTGGPAFPVAGHMLGEHLGGQLAHGMTLRDYFAGQALARFTWGDDGRAPSLEHVAEHLASACYAFADAMIAERSK